MPCLVALVPLVFAPGGGDAFEPAKALVPLLTPMGTPFVARLREVADLRALTTRTRLLMWRAAAEMVADRPLTGVGTDAFVIAYPRHRRPEHWLLEWNPGPARAHSEPVQIAATQGLVGLAAAAAGAALAAFAVSGLSSFTVAATGTFAAALAGWAAAGGTPTAEESALHANVMARQVALAPDPGSWGRARAALDRTLAADSTSASVLGLVAEGYRAIGLAAEARRPLLRCAALYPDFALPLAELAFLALDEGRAADAADTLALALELNWRDVPDGAAVARQALAAARARAHAGAP